MDQTQTPRFISRFEPLLYVPAFTQKDFQSTNLSTQDSHTGNLPEDLGQLQYGVHNSSLNQNNLYTQRQCTTKTPPHTRGVGTQPIQNNHLTLEGFQHQLHLSLEGAKHNPNLSLEGANHHSKINLYTRGIPQIRRVNNQVITKTTNNLFSQKHRSYREDRMIQLKCRKQSVLNKENHLGKSPNRYRIFRPKTNSQKTIFFEITNTLNREQEF